MVNLNLVLHHFTGQAPLLAVVVVGSAVLLTRPCPRARSAGVTLAGVSAFFGCWFIACGFVMDRQFATLRAGPAGVWGADADTWDAVSRACGVFSELAVAGTVLLLAQALAARPRHDPAVEEPPPPSRATE